MVFHGEPSTSRYAFTGRGCSFKQVTFFTTFRLITSLTFDLLTSISNQFIVATARNSAQTLCHKLEKLLWESGRVNFTHGHIAAVMYVRRGQMNIIIIIINKVLIKVTLNKLIAGALYIKCVRLSWPLVGFWAHFKSPHFHSFIHSFISFIHSHLRLKRCESTGLTVNSRMTIETEMSLNADGNTAVTASLTAADRLFHARDAATGNERSNRVDRRLDGTNSVGDAAEYNLCCKLSHCMPRKLVNLRRNYSKMKKADS